MSKLINRKKMSFLRGLININSPESTRSVTLLVSAMVTGLIGICLSFALCWDVIHNGYIKTNLEDAGIFMISMGGFLAGSSVGKIFGKNNNSKYQRIADFEESVNDSMDDNNKDCDANKG